MACGFVFFFLWAELKAVQQSLTLVTLNWTWRAAVPAGWRSSRPRRPRVYLGAFEGVSDGLFFLILMAFVVANVC